MTVPAKITEKNKTSIGHGTGGNAQVWVGPVNRSNFGRVDNRNYAQEYYFPVYNPETKTTDYYVTEKNVFGNNRYIDENGQYSTDGNQDTNIPSIGGDEYRIGSRDEDGNFIVNDSFSPPSLLPSKVSAIKEGFANSQTTQNNLEYSARYTVGDSLRRINGKAATPTQIQQYLPSVSTDSANQLVAATPSLTPQSGQPETQDPDQPEISGEIADLTIGDAIGGDFTSKTGVKDLIYPQRSSRTTTDYVKFTSLIYAKASTSSTGFGFKSGENKETSDGTSVYLPIQGTIADSNGVGWNEETINAAQIAGAAVAIKTMTGGIRTGLSEVNNQLAKAAGNSDAVKNAITAAATEAAVGANILPRVSRAIFNPNTELLFQGPQLRSFTFTFKLTPRNSGEAAVVKDIIKFFKKNQCNSRY